MSALHFRGRIPALTDGFDDADVEFWTVDGRISLEPVADAQTVMTSGWIIPGLVDAHNHVGIAPGLGVTIEQARGFARADARAGALLIREVGSPLDTHPLDTDPLSPDSSAPASTSPGPSGTCATTASTSPIPISCPTRSVDRHATATGG